MRFFSGFGSGVLAAVRVRGSLGQAFVDLNLAFNSFGRVRNVAYCWMDEESKKPAGAYDVAIPAADSSGGRSRSLKLARPRLPRRADR